MMLFSWFSRADSEINEQVIVVKPVAVKHISMWPVAKVKVTNSLVDYSQLSNEEDVFDPLLNNKF